MANVSERDSSSLYIVLERVDPARNIARYYVLSMEPTLSAKHTLIRRWGRIGSFGRERLQFFEGDDASQAQVTLETWLTRKRKRGYAPRSEPRKLRLRSFSLIGEDRMNIHKNARLTPMGRERLVPQCESGQTAEAAERAPGVCPWTASKWLARFRSEGLAGLQDRSSRPIACIGDADRNGGAD